jgi:hypothetical protein
MAGWFIPVLKAVLPHVGDIVGAAKPVFTRKPAQDGSTVQQQKQQIAELQSAVLQNGVNIKELATQLQTTVAALEQAAATAEGNLRRARILAASALGVSVIASALALFALLAR